MGVVAQGRGVIYRFFADVEDAEKHFHVPVTLSEALSTSDGDAGTQRRFSVSYMLVKGVWGSWEGVWLLLGRMGRVYELIVLVVSPEDHKEMIKKPGPRPIDCCQS